MEDNTQWNCEDDGENNREGRGKKKQFYQAAITTNKWTEISCFSMMPKQS